MAVAAWRTQHGRHLPGNGGAGAAYPGRVPARLERHEGPPPEPETLQSALGQLGGDLSRWGNAPGDRYGWHSHAYRKVVACLSGGIVFHTRESGDLALQPGDRLVVDPGTEHAATVGPEGVECAEVRLDGRAGA